MTDIDVRELRYFRTVAEELNFTRAAERLGIAQPPLSRAIRQLERRLDAQLFHRDAGRVTLTAAGRTLLEEAGRVLDAVSAASQRTRRAARPSPTLVVTAKPGVATDLLRQITDAFIATPEAPRVETVISGYGEQAAMVLDGRADVALLGLPCDDPGLDIQPLFSEPRVAALPAGHELAGRASLSCQDLAALPLPQCRPGTSAAVRAYWAGRDQEVTPADIPTGPGPVMVQDSSHLLETVALGQAVALVPTSLATRNRRSDVVYRPVSDASPYTIAIARRPGTRDLWTAHFARVAADLTAGSGKGWQR